MEPRAINVSMFGAPWNRDRNPLVKNFWLMIMTMAASTIWMSPIATWFPSKNAGRGNPNIMCPMEKYMRMNRNPSDRIRRRRSFGVS